MKQRKNVIKYLLIDTEGRTFDKLLGYIHYHSLSDLLMELMQIQVGYMPANSTSIDDETTHGSSLMDDNDGSIEERQGNQQLTMSDEQK